MTHSKTDAAGHSDSLSFSTIILAGGQSSRMGRDKATLETGEGTLLDHMQSLARAAGSNDILVSRNAPGCIPDHFPAAGPLAGLESCLPHCRHSKALVLAVDTPLLGIRSLRDLVQAGSRSAVYFNGSPLPCVLHINESLHAYIRHLLITPGQKPALHQLLEYAGARQVPIAQSELANANTPEVWNICRRQLKNRTTNA